MESSEHSISGSRRTLARLSRMGLRELACRGRQEAYKWIERVQASDTRSATAGDLSEQCLHRFLRNAEAQFFEGLFDKRVPAALGIAAPRHCQELVASADEICQGRVDLLGYRNLDFGDPPNWHLDPTSDRQAPLRHWSLFDPLDHETVGDSKVVWEFNRHQWLVQLGQAYRLTGEERYAERLARHLRSWFEANPRGMGINWTSSLEAGLRIIAWCWAILFIRDSEALDASLFSELLVSIRSHARHIERYLSYYFSPNTHLTGEALGLLYAGVVFPELKHAERWRSLATRILIGEIERQVLPDGVYFERSTCYQRYTADTYLHLLILASRNGLELPAEVTQRLRGMLDALVTLRQPDGSMPSIGDADGGSLLPLSTPRPNDFRPMFSTAAVLFEEPAYAWAAGELAPDTLWLFGTAAIRIFESIDAAPPTSPKCRVFPDGGFAVMRNGWDRESHSLIFDTGPLGCDISSGHGHADLLSIQCSLFGQPYLVDAGTCCYTASQELRDFFRGTAAHSTVMIDGKSQAQPTGPFAWQSLSAAQMHRWISNEALTLADAEHTGYRALPDPVTHRRRVIFVEQSYWIVIDDLTGAESHSIDVRFQFGPIQVRLDADGWARATTDGRRGLLLRTFTKVPLHAEVRKGRRAPLEGWISPNYGQFEPAPAVVYSATVRLPVRMVTLLWPTEDLHETPPELEVVFESLGRNACLVW